MRVLRNVLSAVLVAILGLGMASAVPTSAQAVAKPKRVIEEEPPSDHQVDFNAFKLKGTVTQVVLDPLTGAPVVDPATGAEVYAPYADQKVKLQKKKCKNCGWKNSKTLRTNDNGTFKTRIYAPRTGKWKWRVKVKGSDGFRTTKGKTWTTGFRR